MAIDPSKYQIYAERDTNRANIDWGTVAGTLSKGLDAIRQDREARKQQIEDDTVDAMNKLTATLEPLGFVYNSDAPGSSLGRIQIADREFGSAYI